MIVIILSFSERIRVVEALVDCDLNRDLDIVVASAGLITC
jgi:hypothetical protein